MSEVRDLIERLEAATHYDLGRMYRAGMPQSPNHPRFTHTLPRRHGDLVRSDGGSAANDLLVMGTHVGTHIDALAHVSHNGRLNGGADASTAQVGGLFDDHGAHTITPFIGRGVLLDVGAYRGGVCDPDLAITDEELAAVASDQGTSISAGDSIFIRTGWSKHWSDGEIYSGASIGAPGPDTSGGSWLASFEPRCVGSDTIAFEHIPRGKGHARLPVHGLLLVDAGIPIVETLNLEVLGADSRHEFVLVMVPMPLYGATGAPVRPVALSL